MTALQHNDAGQGPWPSPANPGDLSRRIIQRRTELHLSVGQVAERAQMSTRYVEYLERFPARPTAVALRQLAAALRTTPATLLGGGGDVPPGHQLPADGRMERLTVRECRRLIAPGGIGRVALATVSGPLVMPVNYAYVAATILLRTSVGSAIAARSTDSVAFEVDRIDEALSQGWSVLVRGQAHPMLPQAELDDLTASTDLRPWPRGEHDLYVCIVPDHITGRRVTSCVLSRKSDWPVTHPDRCGAAQPLPWAEPHRPERELLAIPRRDDDYRASRVLDDGRTDRADHQPLKSARATRTDHEHVRVLARLDQFLDYGTGQRSHGYRAGNGNHQVRSGPSSTSV